MRIIHCRGTGEPLTAARSYAAIRVAYKIAESGSETSGTWSGGDSGGLCVVVLRSPTGFATPTAQGDTGDGPTTFPALAQPGVHFRCAYNNGAGWSAPAGTTKIVTGNSDKIGVASTLEHAASADSISTTGSGKYAAITVAINHT